MKIKLRRRDATTLIELIIVLVMMGLFIMMVFNMFSVTFDAYTFNREMSAKLYAQTNVDNFFEMFERELMYAGSMGGVIKKLDDDVFDPNNSINIEQSTITLQYGLAEQLILTKKDKTNYDKINPQPVSSYDLTYFPLYKASVPDNLANRWALVYDDINNVDISSATVLEINSIAKTDVEVTTSEGNKSATLFEIDPADVSITDPATYISILLNEKAFDSLDTKEILLQTGDTKKWRGEMVYKSKIHKKIPENSQESTKIVLKKQIPTVQSEYEITLIDNILDFNVAQTSDLYIATVSYLVPGIYKGVYKKGVEEASVTVTRKFLKTQ